MPEAQRSPLSFLLVISALFILFESCNTIKPYIASDARDWKSAKKPDSEIIHRVYLYGDGGEIDTDEVLRVLRDNIMEEPGNMSSLVFLGDNIYLRGLPEEGDDDREEKEKILKMQMDVAKGYKGNVIFIPGNHDWNYSSPGGLEQVNRQEDFVEEYFGGRNTFLPDNGCAGPAEVRVNDAVTIIAVDTEWWLTKHDKPRAPENGCTVEDKLDFIIQLEDMVRRNDGRHVLITAHHPIFSNGNHGGHYNLLDNIFPLRLVRDNLYIPLPVIGSLYPILRKAGVTPQDIPNADFQQYKKAVLSIIEQRSNTVYAAGHDHNLQLKKHGMMHHIVSGSGAKLNFAARGFGATYVHQKTGFARLTYYKNGEAWVEYFIVDNDNPNGKLAFRSALYALNPKETKAADPKEVPDYRDSVKVMAANENYKTSKFGEFFLGSHYRKEWTTPIEVPYIDLKTYRGGLKPVMKGGGKQTISIRFIDDDSVQYNLRSIDKFPAGAIPEIFKDTWVNNFVKDQTTTSHPYGAFVIPKMSEAIGIYHTEPELYYTPYTPYLGPYIDDFGGRMGMIEIRPDEDLSGYKRFGYSKNIVSTETLFDHLQDDNDNEVDAEMYLRSRYFDMLIGDWDRHDDQWRWAEYEKSDKGSIFRPVPRDRDQVFSLYDGVIPWLLSRKWAFRNFSNFDYEISDILGLNFSARNLDRRLLSGLSQREWMDIARQVKADLTDEVIDEAVKDLPKEVYTLSGPEIASKLKARRNDLIKYAHEYYKFLAEEVDIVGSDKHEFFKVERVNDAETRVQVFKTKKEGDLDGELYDRTFYTDETDEIRLYGRDGHDKFIIAGKVDEGIIIRVIGGDEKEDIFVDSSYVKGGGRKTLFYDNTDNEVNMTVGPETRVFTSEKESINAYNRNYFEYNYVGPRLSFQYNVDDGFYLGGGVKIERHGFRRHPLETGHLILANYAMRTNAFNFKYDGWFYSIFSPSWDLNIDLDLKGPQYVFNYFGQGNETENIRNIDYYRIRMNSFKVNASVVRRVSRAFQIGLGPYFESTNIEDQHDGFLGELPAGEAINTQKAQFAGAKFYSQLSLLDFPINPNKGIVWRNEINYFHELTDGDASYTNLNTDLSVYFTPNLPVRLTFASRFGAAVNIGDFYFYQSNFLGNQDNLRGYRRTRFAGEKSFYNNNELRLKLFNIRNNLLNGDFGFMSFFDQGRVWAEGDSSSKMHRSFGPGVYLHFFEVFLFSGSYGISEEDQLLTFRAGFLF